MSDLNKKLLIELQCKLCFKYMCPPIRLCSKGHSVCDTCARKHFVCICKFPFLSTRNLALEIISYEVEILCEICGKTRSCVTIQNHTKYCAERRLNEEKKNSEKENNNNNEHDDEKRAENAKKFGKYKRMRAEAEDYMKRFSLPNNNVQNISEVKKNPDKANNDEKPDKTMENTSENAYKYMKRICHENCVQQIFCEESRNPEADNETANEATNEDESDKKTEKAQKLYKCQKLIIDDNYMKRICTWKGCSEDISDHYIKAHPKNIFKLQFGTKFQWKLPYQQSQTDTSLIIVNEATFFYQIYYDYKLEEIYFAVQSIGKNVEGYKYKIYVNQERYIFEKVVGNEIKDIDKMIQTNQNQCVKIQLRDFQEFNNNDRLISWKLIIDKCCNDITDPFSYT